jgi:peptide subunit release factor 1 (eRF1)
VITRKQIRDLFERAESLTPPMLSLYVDVNPAKNGNHPKAVLLRVKDTLKALGVPAQLGEEVLALLEGFQEARTAVVFGRTGDLELWPLQVELPIVDASSGHVEARWGDPYLTPLLLAIDEYERYGVAYVDSERARVFELYLGEIDEIQDAFRPPAPGEDDRLRHAKRTYPSYLASRDQSGKDQVSRRMDALTRRFYKRVALDLDHLLHVRGIGRLILMGPQEDVTFFESVLPRSVHDRIVAREPSLSSPEATAGEVLERVREVVGRVEADQERRLLGQIREHGTWGVGRCLEQLQQGRLHVLAVPWTLERDVWVVPEVGFVSTDEQQARDQANGGSVEREPLRAILPELCATWGARIEFMRGENAERVQRELGGMAGLLRW